MKQPSLRIWPATGRYRVKRYWTAHGGPVGRPAYRWAVIGPHGEHIGSVAGDQWPAAQEAADHLARHPEHRW